MNDKILIIYTDGSCLGNPGAGGWAALLIYGDNRKEITGGERHTTNNRMELTAAIEALSAIKKSDIVIILYSDSRYVIDGITKWCLDWEKRNWKTSQKKPIKNKDLWETLNKLNKTYTVQWQWIKAHTDNIENNRVDELAHQSAIKFQNLTSQNKSE